MANRVTIEAEGKEPFTIELSSEEQLTYEETREYLDLDGSSWEPWDLSEMGNAPLIRTRWSFSIKRRNPRI